MSELELVVWYLTDSATIALIVATLLGFLILWGLAAILCRTVGFGATGVFSEEIKAFWSWVVAFIMHAVLVCIVGVGFFVLGESHWSLVFPYVAVFVMDIIFAAIVAEKAKKLATVSW